MVNGRLQYQYGLVIKACMHIVEGNLMVVIDITMHQFHHTFQRLTAIRQQMFLDHAKVVEAVNLIRFIDPCQSLILASQFA